MHLLSGVCQCFDGIIFMHDFWLFEGISYRFNLPFGGLDC